VLTRHEVCAVLQELEGSPRLMATLMYGAGLRLLECARLRIKDVDSPPTRSSSVRERATGTG
jgi:site-specific recombinase XerD